MMFKIKFNCGVTIDSRFVPCDAQDRSGSRVCPAKPRPFAIGFIACALAISFPVLADTPINSHKNAAKYLLMIVMNGVRYNDAFGDKNHLYIDNIWSKLRPLGTICTNFKNRELTFPIPSQMSLLTGIWHVFKNPLSETIPPAFPTLFEYWKSARKDNGNTCYFASNRATFKILACSKQKNFGASYAPVFESSTQDDANENAIYEKALPYILDQHPAFIYLSLGSAGGGGTKNDLKADKCQLPGQKDACGGAELLNLYYESIMQMDAIVYDLWDRIQKDATYKDNTILLVLSSHGRHTDDFHSYGDKCQGCTQLYLLAVGPGIKKNFVSKKERTLIDICRTVGTLCALPTPYAKGTVMKELFD